MRSFRQQKEDQATAKWRIGQKTTEELKEIRCVLSKILEWRKVEKLRSDYIEGTKKSIAYNEEPKVYCDFRFDGTVTGRLSCAGQSDGKGKMGVSFHTLSSEDEYNIRSMYGAKPGRLFITADYSTMELRVLSVISDEKNMQQAFFDKLDMHTYTASQLFNVPFDDVTKKQRKIAKTCNFLVVYGGGPYNLSMTAGISLHEANEAFAQYEASYPRVFEYLREMQAFIIANEYAETIFGRRRHLANIRSEDQKVREKAVRQGANFTVQSPASDIILFAVEGMCRDLESWYTLDEVDSIFKATVHDSIEGEADKDKIIDVCQTLYHNMVHTPVLYEVFPDFDFPVPFEIEMVVGKSFGGGVEVKFDGAGAVTNKEEVLK